MARSKASQCWLIYTFSALLLTLSLFTISGERGVFHLWRLGEEKKRLEERTFLLQQENELLRERIYNLRHDDRYLEKIAREDLGLVRAGEIVYRFPSSKARKDRVKTLTESPSELHQSSEQTRLP